MFTIYTERRSVLTNVEDMAAAESYLAKLGEIILFELDADHEGCADAAVLVSPLDLRTFAIEAAR